MSSTYSPILRSELIGAGDQAGTWGNTTNSNFQYVFESAIAGYVAVTVSPSSNNQVLTYVNGPSASAALDQSIYAMLKLNAGTLGANFNIFAPPVSKIYVVWNNTSYTASFYNSTVIGNTTPGGSAAVIPAGAKVTIWSDGFSFYTVNDTTIGDFTITGNASVGGTLSVGGTSSFTGTATFVGTASFGVGPTAPTAAPGTSTTQLATTAFVQNVAGSLGTMSTQNANAVAITGGTMSGMTSIAGGTVAGTTGTFSGAVSGLSFSGAGTGLTGTASGLNIGGNAATSTQATNATAVNGVAQLCGYSASGQDISYIGAGGPQVTGQSSGAAMMTFIRPGVYAVNFGLGTDNQLRTGGYSRGGSYVVLDSGNYNSYSPTLTGGNASGTWGINISGNASTATNATNATNATYGRYVYDNGAYSGSAGYKEASSVYVVYANSAGSATNVVSGGTIASNVTATTQAVGTNNTTLATTAFVQNVAGALGTMSSQNANNVNITGGTITGSYGLTAANATNAVNATNATTASNANAVFGKTKLGLGITGETWHDVSGSRTNGGTYTNSNSYPILVNTGWSGNSLYGSAVVDGVSVWAQTNQGNGSAWSTSFIVPPGSTYAVSVPGSSAVAMAFWSELY